MACALKYAISKRCFPFYHKGFKIFEFLFLIRPEIQKPFYEYIDEICATKNYQTFNAIDTHFRYSQNPIFKGKGHDVFKNYMIVMLRYAYLCGKLSDKQFQSTLLTPGEYPMEANGIFK